MLCGKEERKVFAWPERSICFCWVRCLCVCILGPGLEVAVGLVHAKIEDLHKSVTTRSSEEMVISELLQAIYEVVVGRVSICGFVRMRRANIMKSDQGTCQ